MVWHLVALAALLVATSGRLIAEGSPLENLALEIVERERGAPVNGRHDAYQRLRSSTDVAIEVVWRVGNVSLRRIEGEPWPDHASREQYRVRDCEAMRVVQASPTPVYVIDLPEAPRIAIPVRAGARRLTLVFAPGSLLAVEATPTAGGGLRFAEVVVLDAELWSEVVRFGPRGPEALPGREPEGMLGRLVPEAALRTLEIEGRILGLGSMGTCPCPRLRFSAGTPGARWKTTQACGIEGLRAAC